MKQVRTKMQKEIDVRLEKVIELSPECIAKTQFNDLKKYTQEILTKMKRYIQHEKFDEALEMLGYSGPNDAYRQENRFINFSDVPCFEVGYINPLDIGNVLIELKHLKRLEK